MVGGQKRLKQATLVAELLRRRRLDLKVGTYLFKDYLPLTQPDFVVLVVF